MNDNIKLTIIGNYIYAKQTGPDSVECGDMPERGTYDKTTHVVISKEAGEQIIFGLNRYLNNHGKLCNAAMAELRAAVGVKS